MTARLPRARRRTLWLGTAASALGVLAVAALSRGCVHPEETMADYLDRTQDLRNQYSREGGTGDSDTNAASFEGTYFMSCLSPLVAGDTTKTLRFAADVNFVATSPGNGTLTMKLQALPIGATTVAGAIGPVFPEGAGASTTVTGGKFSLQIGDTPGLPAEANPLTGVAWGITNLGLAGAFTAAPEDLCANLTGNTRPSGLDAAGTVCLFKRTSGPTDAPTFPTSDSGYVCPG